MKPVTIIGMGLTPNDLTTEHLKIIHQAQILIGGKRLLDFFQDFVGVKKEITRDLKGIIQHIKDRMEKKSIVVLTSGDPLFFGIGSLLVKSLGPKNVVIYPNISSVAVAFSRIKEPWQAAEVISLHGRAHENKLLEALTKKKWIVVLTDPSRNPAWLANFLIEKGIDNLQMCVLEQLGTSSERIDWYELSRAVKEQFQEPNLVILKRYDSQPVEKTDLHLGMPDMLYTHENGLITKAEVRAVTLSKLQLMPEHVLWDLGAGSGSIAIEASLFVTKGKIFAVEKKSDRIAQIQCNQNRFGAKNLQIIQAVLPKGLEDLPRPDRVFIGGGGRNLEKIIRAADSYLKNNGKIVINTVLLPNIDTALQTLKSLGFKTDIIQIQTCRGQSMPWGERLKSENPVWIISGEKPNKELS
ncbi:MAG: precorrin-6y C5,15-methyltransferase (decarboxylating) subunit CbiE [Desulfobacterales bacterium]|nr:precorrin-6y C5,15-methyltransferase (decarboxylating) subunit CbiE [Desulfobacterales bacterium]